MRLRLILPLAAMLALAAYSDTGPGETGGTDTNNPSTTAPANPPPGGVSVKSAQ